MEVEHWALVLLFKILSKNANFITTITIYTQSYTKVKWLHTNHLPHTFSTNLIHTSVIIMSHQK